MERWKKEIAAKEQSNEKIEEKAIAKDEIFTLAMALGFIVTIEGSLREGAGTTKS